MKSEKTLLSSSLNIPKHERALLEKAAQSGDATAASQLGRYFALVEMDDKQAKKWFEIAARFGGKSEREELESFFETEE